MPRTSEQTPASPAHEGSAEGEFTLTHVWRTAQKRLGLFLFVLVGCVAGAAFYAAGITQTYRSVATLMIDPATPRPLGPEVDKIVNVTEYWANKEYFATQIEIISSRSILHQVVQRLALHKDSSFIENRRNGEGATKEGSEGAAIAALRKRLTVEPQRSTRLVEVSFEDADPERARRIVAAVVDTFIEHNVNEMEAATRSASAWLKTQLTNLKGELEDSELTLHKYKKKNQMLSVSYADQSNMLREQISQLSSKITEVKAEREKLSARHEALANVNAEEPEQIPTGELLASPLLGELRGEYIAALRERDSLMASGKGPHHPLIQAASSRLETVKQALMAELGSIQRGVERDLDALEIELNGLNSLFESAKQQALDLNLMEIQYKRLERLKDNNEKMYSMVLESATETDLTALMHENNIRIIDPPQVGAAVSTGTPIIIGAGVLLGLLLGAGVATGREYMDRSIKTPDELERCLGASMLGFLPKDIGNPNGGYRYGQHKKGTRRRSKPMDVPLELVVHEHPTGILAEAARAIRTNITFTAPDKPYRKLVVASPGPAEGKTTIACWIATAMAQAGHKVLLMDCDLRRPRLHKVFGKSRVGGVSEAVLDRALLDELDLSTGVPNLSILTSGSHVPNPAEILGSDSFQKLLEELSCRFDRIIIDSPPITAVTDATILSAMVDGTVFVVRAFSTNRDVAIRSIRALRDIGSHIVGSVLNGADLRRSGKGYYEYYYYSGKYGGEDAA